jgi:uncharacterized protein with PQ loop repeat
MNSATAFGSAAFIVGRISNVPHLRSAWRQTEVGASSALGWMVMAMSSICWIVYSIHYRTWWSAFAGTMSLAMESAMAFRINSLRLDKIDD